MKKRHAWHNEFAVWILIGGICCATQSLAYTATVNGVTWTYTVSNGKATIENPTLYLGNNPAIPTTTTGAITIPSSLGGYPVTCIGASACKNCTGLTSVTIPSSVTNIGGHAFYKCSGLKKVVFGRSVKNMGDGAFAECSSLSSVTFPSDATISSIGHSAFDGCSSLTSITIPASVTAIEFQAFMYSGLKSITIPDHYHPIGNHPVAVDAGTK